MTERQNDDAFRIAWPRDVTIARRNEWTALALAHCGTVDAHAYRATVHLLGWRHTDLTLAIALHDLSADD